MVPVKSRFAVALLFLLLSASSWAALGKIDVRSRLGEPFSGEIALTDVREADLPALKVGLAERAVFDALNVAYSPALDSLRFSVASSARGGAIRLTSTRPIVEPNLHFVLVARGAGGRVQREYLVMLDPASAAAPMPAQQAQAAMSLASSGAASAAVADEAGLESLRDKVKASDLALKQERLRIAGLEQQLKALELANVPPPWWRTHLREIGMAAAGVLVVLVLIWGVKWRRSHAAAKRPATSKRPSLLDEADACLAQGDLVRAEDLLKEALLHESLHDPARQRLLDVYAGRPDPVRFEALAREVHAYYDGRGAAWERVVGQGRAIDPDNPLYQPGAVVAPTPRESMLELDGLGAVAFAPPSEPAPADNDLSFFDLSDSLMTAPAAPSASVASAAPEPEPEPVAEAAVAGNDMLDFDFAIDAAPVAATNAQPGAAQGYDLADTGKVAASPDDADSMDDGLQPPAFNAVADAGSTKLDLARVYLDMGDRDGAREVLGDLIKESQGALKEQAEALLASIA